MTQQYSIDTLLAQAGNRSDERTGAVLRQFIFQQLMATMGLVKVPGLIIRVRKIQRVLF